jgi:hypothetical protein
VLGSEGRRGLGARNITLIVSVLFAYVFGSTAWKQAAEMPADVPPAAHVIFTVAFVLLGLGIPWLVYLVLKLLSRLFGGGRNR